MEMEFSITQMEINTLDSSSMAYLKASEPITGLTNRTIEEISSKPTETVMVYGPTQRQNNILKDTTCLIENMDMDSMTGPMGTCIKEILLKIKGAEKDNFTSKISCFITVSGSMAKDAKKMISSLMISNQRRLELPQAAILKEILRPSFQNRRFDVFVHA